MALDSMVANPGRLRILTALAAQTPLEFVRLRQLTHLTDGNLATHARRLAQAGMIRIDKSIEQGKPLTRLGMTSTGRQALESHARELMEAVGLSRAPANNVTAAVPSTQDDWID